MPTGVASRVAYKHEPDGNYGGAPTDSTFKTLGRDAVVTELSFSNALQRMRLPDDPEIVEAIATVFEGAISVSANPSDAWFLNHVFGKPPTQSGSGPYTYSWDFTQDTVQSARFYAGIRGRDGTVREREVEGVVFPDAQIRCTEGEAVSVQLTGFYRSESRNTGYTPGSQPTAGEEPLLFHGGDIEIPTGSSYKTEVETATLQITTGATGVRGWNRFYQDAVIGPVETDLSTSFRINQSDNLELAYGSSNAPASTDIDGAADGRLSFGTEGTTQLDFNLTTLTHEDYDWPDLGDPNAGEQFEDMSFVVNGVTADFTTTQSSAL